MVNHRAQAQFERARWRRCILFPVWTLQLLLAASMTGLFAWRLSDTVEHWREDGKVEFAWEITNIVMSFVAATCSVIEIVRYVAEALTPWTMLFTHVIKLACASAICVLDAVVYARRKEYQSLIGLGLDIGLFITAMTLAIYAALTYRRLSRFDDYIRPVNVKGYGFNDSDENHYSRRRSIRDSIDKSLASRRQSVGFEPLGLQTIHRTPSYYSHERDTQFDEYRARRNSANGLRPHLESRRDASSSPPDASSLAVSRSRAVSYTSDHVLVAVPEEESEAGAGDDHDETRLLGHARLSSDDNDAVVLQEADVRNRGGGENL